MQLHPPDKKIQNYVFSFKSKLGKGAYGTVYLGKNEKTDQIVALKVIEKKILSTDYAQQLINQEIELMKKIDNPHIVKLIDVLHSVNNTYIITEYCNGGDLREYLKKRRSLPEEEALKIFRNIIQGIKDLVMLGIIHRDIKPANILSHDGVFKLTDFGFAREVDSFNETIMNSLVGTPLYMSPQILKRQQYTSKCDVWSLGLILYEMIYGYTPWHSQNLVELMAKLDTKQLTFPITPKISDTVQDLIRQCLAIKEEQRIDWDSLFKHPLVSGLPQIKVMSNHSALCQPTSCREKENALPRHRSNSKMPVCIPQKFNEYYVKTQQDQHHSRERSLSTLERFKTLVDNKTQQTPPVSGKNYHTQKLMNVTNIDSTPSASNSTNTTISSGRPKIQVNQFDAFKQKQNTTMFDPNDYFDFTMKVDLPNAKKKSIFEDIRIDNTKLKRTNSLSSRVPSMTQLSIDKRIIISLLKSITNQLDLIPSQFAIKLEVHQMTVSINKRLTRDELFQREDLRKCQTFMNFITESQSQNTKGDHYLAQLHVLQLLLGCYLQIVQYCLMTKSVSVSPALQEQVQKMLEVQKEQLDIPVERLQRLVEEAGV